MIIIEVLNIKTKKKRQKNQNLKQRTRQAKMPEVLRTKIIQKMQTMARVMMKARQLIPAANNRNPESLTCHHSTVS